MSLKSKQKWEDYEMQSKFGEATCTGVNFLLLFSKSKNRTKNIKQQNT